MHKNFILKEWDSQFFNRRIFSFELPAIETASYDWPKKSLTTIKIGSADYPCLDVINRHGFSFVEGELVFKKALPVTVKPASLTDFNAYLATKSSIDELKLIVSDLYVNSRFREPWFSSLERDNFYQMWAENAVLSKFDDCCLVLKSEGSISGFVTIRIRGEEATIGLIGVAEPFQGQGIGKKLLELVQDYCISKKATAVKVATQTSNISAANLYSKAGFAIADISYWFYKQV
ncbi:GNAT family N-acetyltransferase [Pseudoalteromonas sp. SWN166]|uniref:GNAT family N-acetyltransferase n=1 Tax=Pseudoalteromonas sp. SWN166 TaxID=2792061 RepID=UPI0018CDA535|nr:GNAT family N-acetyltransferase [Pseudoalteromonas sp. SWN166]MBH0038953.1 GNAT family N-acetyltransferase [Pseudoalteromonas sp. SWN166]